MLYQYEKFCHASQLNEEIDNSSIIKELDSIQTEGSFTNIVFLSELSVEEKSILDTLVQNHSPIYQEIPLINQPVEIKNTEIDEQGRQIIRMAAGQVGWAFLAHPIEFKTAKLGSLYEKKVDGTDRAISTVKFYDANGTEVTDAQYETDIVKTVILVKPPHDFEIIAGSLHQIERPTTNARIYVIAGIIELGGAYVKEFIGGINMKFIGADEQMRFDGRAAKYMKKDIVGVPYQANQFQITVKHDAGVNHDFMFMLEYFRA